MGQDKRLEWYMRQIISNKKTDIGRGSITTQGGCFLKPAYCGSIRTGLPLTVIPKKDRRLVGTMSIGQLFCVGRVYLKTHNGTIRIR